MIANPSLRRLLLARAISVSGDMMVPLALAFAILELTGSAAALGLVLAARALPSLILMLHGGAMGDRHSPKTVMVGAQLVAAAAQIGLGTLILLRIDGLVALCALVAVRGATSAFFNPASTAAFAIVANERQRQTAFSLFAVVGAVSEVGGPVIAGALMVFLNPGWVIVLDGLTFVVSAVLVVRCQGLSAAERPATRRSMLSEIRDGLVFVRQTSWLGALILSASIFQFSLLSSLNVLGPLVADRSLGGASSWALVVSAMGLGGILGGFIGIRIKPRRPLLLAYGLGALAAGPTLVLLAMPAPLWAIATSEFVAGAAITLFGTIESTVIANHVPRGLLSRVDSLNRVGSMGLKPLGMAVAAPIAQSLGLRVTLLGAAALGMTAMLMPLLSSTVRGLGPTATEEAGHAHADPAITIGLGQPRRL